MDGVVTDTEESSFHNRTLEYFVCYYYQMSRLQRLFVVQAAIVLIAAYWPSWAVRLESGTLKKNKSQGPLAVRPPLCKAQLILEVKEMGYQDGLIDDEIQWV